MEYMISTNFQDDLIPHLKRYGVSEVYGKLPEDCIGGGRPSHILPQIDREQLSSHVARLHENNIDFNYVLNAVNMDNREFTRAGKDTIHELLEFLTEAKTNSVTVAIPFLFEFIKKYYPHFAIHTSSFAMVNSPEKAQYWERLGTDKITLLSKEVNRDFPMLKAIRKSVRCELQVIGNNACLENCPIDYYHHHLNTNASHTGRHDDEKTGKLDYCILYCNHERFANPMGFIRSDWIRPEDVHYYEEIGIDSLKLVDRSMPTSDLARIIEAYANRRYDGNLLDILHVHFKRHLEILSLTMKDEQSPGDLVYVNNRDLDGFLDYFVEKDRRLETKENYMYYLKTAKKVVQIDPAFKREISSAYKHAKNELFLN